MVYDIPDLLYKHLQDRKMNRWMDGWLLWMDKWTNGWLRGGGTKQKTTKEERKEGEKKRKLKIRELNHIVFVILNDRNILQFNRRNINWNELKEVLNFK